jgi:hypothetical protein
LTKDNLRAPEGGYKLYVYDAKNLTAVNNFDLRDANENWLKVLSFDNDPATGDAFIAGCIINPKRERQFITALDYSYTPYLGLFTLDLDKKDYYKVVNPDTKSNYMIIDDEANIYIYNVNSKKIVRTIPHRDGNVKINVYSAKEGHMMVSEYNRKEKYTRFSIEAL